MSKAVLNNSQATGHTNLLSSILKVYVRNDEKITEHVSILENGMSGQHCADC